MHSENGTQQIISVRNGLGDLALLRPWGGNGLKSTRDMHSGEIITHEKICSFPPVPGQKLGSRYTQKAANLFILFHSHIHNLIHYLRAADYGEQLVNQPEAIGIAGFSPLTLRFVTGVGARRRNSRRMEEVQLKLPRFRFEISFTALHSSLFRNWEAGTKS